MLEILQFVFMGFWYFVGFCIIGACILDFILKMWCRLLRHITVCLRGWPPSHLDADGDWKPEPKKEDEWWRT